MSRFCASGKPMYLLAENEFICSIGCRSHLESHVAHGEMVLGGVTTECFDFWSAEVSIWWSFRPIILLLYRQQTQARCWHAQLAQASFAFQGTAGLIPLSCWSCTTAGCSTSEGYPVCSGMW